MMPVPMRILGVSCFYHDAAAALVDDGLVVAAAEEERFTRRKHDSGFPSEAIAFCLGQAGLASARDLDYVVFYEKPLVKFERILQTALRRYPRTWRTFGEAMIAWMDEKLWIKALLQSKLGVPPARILFTEHHIAHAASAFFASPFEEAAVLTVDGVGEWTTTAVGRATASWNGRGENRIDLTREMRFPHSLGLLYSAFTAFLGFEVNEGEYKVMGMAPYGEPKYVDRVHRLLRVADDGSFELNMDYFCYEHSPDRSIARRFERLFGPPRAPEAPFVTPRTDPAARPGDPAVVASQYYADVAASIQRVTEDILVKMATELQRDTGLTRLCLAGGVALNSVANGRILRESGFEELFIQPAAGDSGGALGAALYACHALFGRQRRWVMEHAYLGQHCDEGEVRRFLRHEGIAHESFPDDGQRLVERVVDDLVAGRVVGWSQGRFEWGPRALGNRSIIADPRCAAMKEIVNEKIKFREPFRPFAPAILENRVPQWFEGLDAPGRHYPARFMLLVLPWREGPGARVPAVNHEGTGRLQTVRADWNPRYCGLIEGFEQATGVPVLMNTSFNLRGEPIVTTPADAFSTFSRSGLDVLVLGDCIVRK
jgi:carbamoyltransferase